MPVWKTSELRILRDHYKGHNLDAICKLLTRHSKSGVRNKASELMGKSLQEHKLRWLRLAHEHYARRERGLMK